LAGGAAGGGVVFELTPPSQPGGPWAEAVLHNFGREGDGYEPVAGLALSGSGALLGTTPNGGEFDDGVVFRLSRPEEDTWHYDILYSFDGGTGVDGASPSCSLIQNRHVLYGTTRRGGDSNAGTVFQLTPPSDPGGAWTETTLYSFTGGKDGASPEAGVLLQNGALYGTTSGGGRKSNGIYSGVAFQLRR
jgi:uncharacterized repeat protein (TIGR03803 family)